MKAIRSSPGFTLLEVLFAVTILVIIMGVCYTALSQITRSKTLLDDRRDSDFIVDAILQRMTHELQLADFSGTNSILPPANQATTTSPPGLELLGERQGLPNGERGDSITFLAREGGQYLPDGGSHSGTVQISYRVERDPEANSYSDPDIYYLIRDEIPYIRPVEEAYKKKMTFPVTSRLVSLEFQYYNSEREEWVDTWDEKSSRDPPAMIRYTVAVKSPRGKIERFRTAVPIRSDATN